MTLDQIVLTGVLFSAFGLFLWGRWRFDIVAFLTLLLVVFAGIVPYNEMFSGFSHPATITVVEVLIISRALRNAGIADLITRHLSHYTKNIPSHITSLSFVGAFLSMFMNNVGAIALMIPTAIHSSWAVKRSPSYVLMPLSFATLLGGLVTLIGTPPNIILSAYRQENLGQAFAMFDFAYVGLPVAVIGIFYVAFIGWRLLPHGVLKSSPSKPLFEIEKYLTELSVEEKSPFIDKTLQELKEAFEGLEVRVVGALRDNAYSPQSAFLKKLQKDDIILVETIPEELGKLSHNFGLELFGSAQQKYGFLETKNKKLYEVIVSEDSFLVGKKVSSVRFFRRFAVSLLAVSRQKHVLRDRLGNLEFQEGDILLFYGDVERLPDIPRDLGCMPLAERELLEPAAQKLWLTLGIFIGALVLTALNIMPIEASFGLAAFLLVVLGMIPLHELYKAVDWPVIVLIGSFITVGKAFETVGLANNIAFHAFKTLSYLHPILLIAVLMAITMTLTDILNNTATAVIMAPLAVTTAQQLGISPDALLMTVAVSSSCSFLTPIGHKNNALVMGPGGYRFGDYWRMGLPLEILILIVATPLIYYFWL